MTEQEIIESLTVGRQKSISPRSIEINYPEFYYKIDNIIDDVIWRAKLFMYINELSEVPKCYCGNPCKYVKFGKGFSQTCSKECSNTDKNEFRK